MKILVTGANGHLGLQFIARVNRERPQDQVLALVRSDRARQQLLDAELDAEIHVVDYRDSKAIGQAGQGCDAVIHLVGIIKETPANSFSMAHEEACRALVDANLAASRIICLGIVGTNSATGNACLKSRADAEQILASGRVPAIMLHVPMVLGPDDYASYALSRRAKSKVTFTFRSSSLEQPIYSEDVVSALIAALTIEPRNQVLVLAGTESISRADLIRRAARRFGNSPVVLSIPVSVGMLLAWVMEKVSGNPPVTRAMLGVLDHDDVVDVSEATQVLGIKLTSLDDTLAQIIR